MENYHTEWGGGSEKRQKSVTYNSNGPNSVTGKAVKDLQLKNSTQKKIFLVISIAISHYKQNISF